MRAAPAALVVIAALVMMDAENWRSGRRFWRWALLAALVLGRLGVKPQCRW